ncbi:BMP family ABC transporter substrate-binding protein [Saliniramus sp.]|uniref:BMP family ABC transporter substrate-binding protein n=1 Tax=Saliniramus sp. TaxID=2986772 RepID=UPI002B78B1FB|nr:BMP family ABC transporter substrate-binding protein [Saliniramus sp.]HMB11163.1 BMP family ABC transporter substrate-binding protein [Saliniramus sp.]
MKRRDFVAASALAAMMAFGAVPAQAQSDEPVKVGFVFVGPVGDFGWTYQHNQGRLAIEEAFGEQVETTFVESVSGGDAERVIEQLARTGHDLIFTTSFGYMEPTIRVAERFPDVKFEHATGFRRADNVATYNARFHEGRYILGQIAAEMTESGVIGYIGAFPIPEVTAGMNAYILGAQSVNPDIELRVVYVNAWFDPARETDAARALMDQGADVIAQHVDSPAAMQTAADRSVYGFGQASDMIDFAPDTLLTSIVNNWTDYYVDRVQAVIDGTWEPSDTWGGLSADMIGMAPYTNMPDDVAERAAATEEAIRSGELNPFTCPIIAQDGSEVPCEGDGVLSDDQVRGMNFFVQGIADSLPN